MGKRKREAGMEISKGEKHRALKEKYKELEQHQYWNHSNNLRSLNLFNRSPRELISCLQTEHTRSLSSDEEKNSSVCSDCLESQESDEGEVTSVVVSSASVRDDTSYNETVDDGINKFYDEEKETEIDKGPGEMSRSSSTNVKNAEKIRNVGWEFSVLIIALVLIGLLVLIAAILSVHATWYVDQEDLDQLSKLHRRTLNTGNEIANGTFQKDVTKFGTGMGPIKRRISLKRRVDSTCNHARA